MKMLNYYEVSFSSLGAKQTTSYLTGYARVSGNDLSQITPPLGLEQTYLNCVLS